MLKSIVCILVLSVLFFGCKKYPEDETFLHLKRPEKRLTDYSPWYVETFTVDGVDSLPFVNTKYSWMAPIEKKENYLKGGDVDFNKNKNEIRVPIVYDYIAFKKDANPYWRVIQLDKFAFAISTVHNNKLYYLKFKTKK